MAGLRNEVVTNFNRLQKIIRTASVGETFVSAWSFNDGMTPLFNNIPPSMLRDITLNDYSPAGYTALYDSVIDATNQLSMFGSSDDSYLLYVITDGCQCPTKWHGDMQKRIQELNLTDRWTLAFQVPNPQAAHLLTNCGILPGNITVWDATPQGLEDAIVQTQSAYQNFSSARLKGATRSIDFYAKPDLSHVSPAKLTRQCQPMRGFLTRRAEKETDTKSFYEKTTGNPYVIGSVYYQLMKPETVQETKQILIRDKNTGKVYTGPNTRPIVGIPVGARGKVEPGNHANYDIFVQSTSVNRKIPRGTMVIIDCNQTTNLAPTWDHNSVKRSI
jgi:hypothetical protein